MSATNIQKPIYHYAFSMKKGEEGDVSPLHDDFKKAYFAHVGTFLSSYWLLDYEVEKSGYGTTSDGIAFEYGEVERGLSILQLASQIENSTVRKDYSPGNYEIIKTADRLSLLILLENPLSNCNYLYPFFARLFNIESSGGDKNPSELFYFAAKFAFKNEDVKSYLIEGKVRRFASLGFNLPEVKSEFASYGEFLESFVKNPNRQTLSRYTRFWNNHPDAIYDDEFTETRPEYLATLNYDPEKTLKISDLLSSQGHELKKNQVATFKQVYPSQIPQGDAFCRLHGYSL